MNPLAQKRFWDKVQKGSTCWEWIGSKNKFGYGQITIQNKGLKAHRVAYFLYYRIIDPSGFIKVLHKCDNPSCVNPAHLFEGTQTENIQDMVIKRRQRNKPLYGENNPMSKLTWAEVEDIRRLYSGGNISQKQLSNDYMVSPMTINRIVNGISWKEEKI